MIDHNPKVTELAEELRLFIPDGYDAVGLFGCFRYRPMAMKGEDGLAELTPIEFTDSARAAFISAMEELRRLLPPDCFMWDEQEELNKVLRPTYGVSYGPYSEVVVHTANVPATPAA